MKNKNKEIKSKKNLIKLKVTETGIEGKRMLRASEKIKVRIINILLSTAYKVVFFQNICALASAMPSKSKKLQGSIEYIMILSAVTIIVVIALSMMTQLKGVILHSFYNTSNQSGAQLLSKELKNLSSI